MMIDTPAALDQLVARALTADAVALDTEFVWERTYYPKLGVVQLGLSADDLHLIDAAKLDLALLGPLLAAPDVVKILHDAQQDLTILRRATGTFARTVFDTQRAAGFVGLASTLSLGDLAQATVGVHLPKGATRTDWLRRPLSAQQTAYALDDVRYLPAVREALLDRARERGRLAWIAEEMVPYDDPALYEEKDPDTQHERIGGTGRLSPQKRAVLRELAAWREREARRQDRPRGHVLEDAVLAALARRPPQTQAALAAVRGLGERQARRYDGALLQAIGRGLAAPAPPPSTPRTSQDEALAARIRLAVAYLTGKGLAEGVDPALLATRAEVTALVAAGPDAPAADHALLQGWRRTFIGNDLLDLLTGRLAIRLDPATGLPQRG